MPRVLHAVENLSRNIAELAVNSPSLRKHSYEKYEVRNSYGERDGSINSIMNEIAPFE